MSLFNKRNRLLVSDNSRLILVNLQEKLYKPFLNVFFKGRVSNKSLRELLSCCSSAELCSIGTLPNSIKSIKWAFSQRHLPRIDKHLVHVDALLNWVSWFRRLVCWNLRSSFCSDDSSLGSSLNHCCYCSRFCHPLCILAGLYGGLYSDFSLLNSTLLLILELLFALSNACLDFTAKDLIFFLLLF